MRFHRTKTCISVFFKPPQKSVYVHRSVRCIWIIDIHFPQTSPSFSLLCTAFRVRIQDDKNNRFLYVHEQYTPSKLHMHTENLHIPPDNSWVASKFVLKYSEFICSTIRFHPFGTLSNIMSLIFQSQIDFPLLRFPDRPP